MKAGLPIHRRALWGFVIALFAQAALAFPTKPASIIVPQAPGGANDVLARMVAGKLQEYWGMPVLVDFKPGGGVIVATQYVARSAPDGHVIGLVTAAHAINPGINDKLPYDSVRDFVPVARLGFNVIGLAVVPSLKIDDVKGLIDLARAKPDFLSHGSNGIGTGAHLAGELFKHMTGVKMVHVPYKGGGPAMIDLIGGQVHAMFTSVFLAAPQVKAGKIKAVGVSSERRSALLPESPTFVESGFPGFVTGSWSGLFAPAGTPTTVIARLHADFSKAMRTAEVEARFRDLGTEAVAMPPAEFAAFLRIEHDKLGRLIRELNVTVN